MQWKRQPDNDYLADWQGTRYRLSQSKAGGQWYLFANGKQVKEHWAKSRQAMEAIESRQQKLILEAAKQWKANGILSEQKAVINDIKA